MPIDIVQVDAFTARPFSGNPAAVCVLTDPETPPDWWLQEVAREMNLSETAFVVAHEDGFDLRWFTPTAEVDLCGHATLAAAHWLWERGLASDAGLTFRTRSGDLGAARDGEGRVVLDLPLRPVLSPEPPAGLDLVLGDVPCRWVGTAAGVGAELRNGVAVVPPETLFSLAPDHSALAALPLGGLIVTARPDPADERFVGVDVISRYFAPAVGVPEDHVTGSAHCTLVDLWAGEIGREMLRCGQVSPRGGDVVVTRAGGRAMVVGHAVTVSDVSLRQRP